MVFRNDTDNETAGELNFPMPDGPIYFFFNKI